MVFVQRFPIVHASQYKLGDPVLYESHDSLDTNQDEGDEAESAMGRSEVWVVSFVDLYRTPSVTASTLQ